MNNILYPLIRYLEQIDKEKISLLETQIENEKYENLNLIYKIIVDSKFKKNINKKYIYKLTNIFDNQKKTYFPYKELCFDDKFLIRFEDKDKVITYEKWGAYINKVIKEINRNKNDFTKLYYTCMKYFSNIPAVNVDKCYLSLFDVCKVTSALSNCMENNSDDLILIKGDFSGIQKFIYKTNDDGALKNLKGRSLYLTILQDLCAKYIVRELKLDISNILYSGGGNFYIVANSSKIDKFNKLHKKLSEIILNSHKGEIYLAISCKKFKIEDLENFSEVWREVGSNVGISKNKAWSEVGLQDNFKKIFGPFDKGGSLEKSCRICGGIKSEYKDNCEFCDSLNRLVDVAKNKRYYIEKNIDCVLKESYKNIDEVFNAIGFSIEFTDKIFKANDSIKIYSINDLTVDEVDGYVFKSIKFNSKSLDEISISKNKIGDRKIGVLKLDVDNLGQLFIQTKDIVSVIGLSRNMSMFFEGFIEQIIFNNKNLQLDFNGLKTNLNWEEKITIVYAGGDDTFVVGRYDELFEFSYILREAFRSYVKSDNKTFTAGVGMFNSNFPILRTAEISEGFLDKGKDTEEKDKICFLGQVFEWEDFKELIELKNCIEEIFIQTNNKSVFEKINKSTKGFRAIFNKKGNKINYMKIYKLAYFLRELKNGDNKEVEILVDNLVKKYEELCLKSIKENKFINKIMIIPYSNKWAQCNCRTIEKEFEINE
ncbi:type III-A CRISPR-associated protein Cas10/Csm1 [uncultured Clostridium sp.]|uniref:type III-A CRISPR-associated protein Cas10/Csm1 n=1 Tax=uncultured Clostridium sp. TaxID=59620 RepID=UPI0025E8BA92|nr:type III-A CRISPR-associated protein Cas10/Csm1 [uncultured Clostridium sp.]